jgi:hypothetical protein
MTLATAAKPASSFHRLREELVRKHRHLVTKLIIGAEWVVLLAGVGYLCGRTLPRAWQKLDTDFPNYYLTARLLSEGYDTDRIYDWIWVQRQKDRVKIEKGDQAVVAFVSLTPFSALLVRPLTSWEPLAAKHVWICFNLALLVPVGLLIHSLTSLELRRIALLMMVTFPLHRNLQYGQYYILLLLVFTASLWLYIHKKRMLAGLLLGIAAGLKVFPALFLLYFLRKKDLKAAGGLILGSIATLVASIAAFGFELNRTYLQQVLPWTLRGEGMDPYALAANSLSSLLHHLFVFEAEWNPHPLLHAPILVAVLQPVFQFLMLSPAILLASARDMRPRQLQLEWAAYVASLLAISTMPASYQFTLLVLPMAIATSVLIDGKRFRELVFLALLYLGTCFPLWTSVFGTRESFLAVFRLWLAIAFSFCCFVLLWQQRGNAGRDRRNQWAWSGVLGCLLALEVSAGLHHLQGVFDRSVERLPTQATVFLATEPVAYGDSTLFVSMSADGYQAGKRGAKGASLSDLGGDQLALTTVDHRVWVEKGGLNSKIVSVGPDLTVERLEIENAEFPVASPDGRWLAYLRSEYGRSRIWLHDLRKPASVDIPITPPSLNVFEMSFSPRESIAFTAAKRHQAPHVFLIDIGDTDRVQQVIAEESRYPAISPDGKWLAYSRRSGGVWNLWLRRMGFADGRRLTKADCNDVSPSWDADSRTLLFASDCGRAFGLTALYRQHILP